MNSPQCNRLTLFSIILGCMLLVVIISTMKGQKSEKGPSSSVIKGQPAKTNEFAMSWSRLNGSSDRSEATEIIWKVSKEKRLAAIQSHGSEFKSNPWGVFGMATLWDLFTPAYNCPSLTERVGRLGDGGKWICGFPVIAKKKPCIVYSYGISGEITFEEEILQRSNCKVRMFDHTINVESGPAADLVKKYPNRASLYKFGLGASNTKDLRTLKTEMKQHGDKFIDILKMDTEGAEFEGMNTIIRDFPDKLPIGQVQVELHLGALPGNTFDSFTKWFDRVEDAGLRAFSSEPNYIATIWANQIYVSLIEFSFLNRKMDPNYFHE